MQHVKLSKRQSWTYTKGYYLVGTRRIDSRTWKKIFSKCTIITKADYNDDFNREGVTEYTCTIPQEFYTKYNLGGIK